MSTTVSARFIVPGSSLACIMATLNKEFNVIINETVSELVEKGVVSNVIQLAQNEKFKTSLDMKFEISSFYNNEQCDMQSIFTSFYIKGEFYYMHIFNSIYGNDVEDYFDKPIPHVTISLGSDPKRATPELIQRFAFAIKEKLNCQVLYKDEAVSDDHREI